MTSHYELTRLIGQMKNNGYARTLIAQVETMSKSEVSALYVWLRDFNVTQPTKTRCKFCGMRS